MEQIEQPRKKTELEKLLKKNEDAVALMHGLRLLVENEGKTDGQLRILAVRKLAMDAQSANENTP